MGKRALFSAVLIAFVSLSSIWLWHLSAPLSVITRGGAGPPTVVLLHGYGSRAEDWLQFDASPPSAGEASHWEFPPNTRRVYPQAPLRHPVTGRRGWWWLHLEGYVARGDLLPDLSTSRPGGIKVASRLVVDAIRNEPRPLILGGFSQGAMTAAEVAFETDQDLAGLILLSGTTVDENAWADRFAGLRRLPIFIAHGRQDAVLSFAIMERFQHRLRAFGLDVTWLPFDGGHEIPRAVVEQVNKFVERVVQIESTAGRH